MSPHPLFAKFVESAIAHAKRRRWEVQKRPSAKVIATAKRTAKKAVRGRR
jgi:hypothetical protein